MSCPFPVFDFRASLWVPTSVQGRPFVLSQGTDRAGWTRVPPGPFRARRPTRRIDRVVLGEPVLPVPIPLVAGELSALNSGVAPPGSSTVLFPSESDHRSPRDRTDGAGGVLRRVACVASFDGLLCSRCSEDDRMTFYRRDRAPIVESRCGRCRRVLRVHLQASLRDPAASHRTGADDRRTREERPGVRTACTVSAGSESSGQSCVTEPCPEGPPAGESLSSEEPVSPATEVEHDLPATDVRRLGRRRERPRSRKDFPSPGKPGCPSSNILSLFRVEAPNRDENVTRLDVRTAAPSVTPPLGSGRAPTP